MAVLHAYFQWTGLLVWSLVPFDSGVLALTKAVLATDRAEAEARSIRHCANDSGAAELIGVIDTAVPLYLERVDQGALVYPACTKKCTDQNDIQQVWADTRLEAVRYLTMVPGRQVELLIDPARQLEMFDAFLRRQPHEKTVIDFTGVPADDLVLAIIAGLNWLNHCALLAGVQHIKFSGTLRNFRKAAAFGQQWWSLEGAEARCAEKLRTKEKPPLMLYVVWKSYTMLSKEVATATMFGSSTERTVVTRRKKLEEELAEHPTELDEALAELKEAMSRFDAAQQPDDLLGQVPADIAQIDTNAELALVSPIE